MAQDSVCSSSAMRVVTRKRFSIETIIPSRPTTGGDDCWERAARWRASLHLYACDTWRTRTAAHCAAWTNPDRGVRRGRPRGPGRIRLDREIYSIEPGDTDVSQRIAWWPRH